MKRQAWLWLAAAMLAAAPMSVVADDSAPATTGRGQEIVYVMRPGESLAEVARMFRVSVADLAARNGIADPSRLQIGQTLHIPDPLVSEIAAVSAERAELADQVRGRDAELAALHRQVSELSTRLEHAVAETAALESSLRATEHYRRDAVALLAVLVALAMGGAWTLRDRNRLVERVAALTRETALLAEARERYRTAVAQLELRYQKLLAPRPGETVRVDLQIQEGVATLRRVFAEGTARIESLVAARPATPAAPPTERALTLFAPLRRLRFAGHREP